MERRTMWLLAGGATILIVGAVIAAPFFLPKKSVTLDQDLPPGMEAMDGEAPTITTHRSGQWRDGDSAHKASGGISIVTVDGETYLRFEGFQMTSGPDVYLYLTESPSPRSTADVEADGVRIAVKTDEDKDARLNERGTFFVPLGISLDELSAYGGVAAWCDDFNVLFGNAALS